MIRARVLILVFVASLIASACTTLPATDFDWCYRWDFTRSSSGFSISTGEWIDGTGIATEASGSDHYIAASFIAAQTVSPEDFVIRVTRGAQPGAIDIAAQAIAFGATLMIDQTLPAQLNNAAISYTPSSNPNEQPIGQTVNFALNASKPIAIAQLEVRGDNANPFGQDNCSDPATETPPPSTPTGTLPATNTPQPSQTPTLTITPSATLTPTQTLTPSPTSEPMWSRYFDFTVSNWGWTPASTQSFHGVYSPGVGFTSVDGSYHSDGYNSWRRVTISKTGFYSPVTHIKVFFNISGGYVPSGQSQTTQLYGAYQDPISGSFSEKFFSPAFNFSSVGGHFYFDIIPTWQQGNGNWLLNGSATITGMLLEGLGPDPFSDLPTNTPTVTLTPTITRTPTITPTSATVTPGGATLTPIPLTGRPTRTVTPSRTPIWIRTPTPRPTINITPNIGTGTPNATPTFLPTRTFYPTRTIVPMPTAGNPQDSGDDPDGDDDGIPDGGGVDCDSQVEHSNPIEWAYYSGREFVNCTVMPVQQQILRTLQQASDAGLQTASNAAEFAGDVFGWTLGTINNLVAYLQDVLRQLGDLFAQLWQFVLAIGEILKSLIGIVTHFLAIIGDYINQFFLQVQSILDAFSGEPQAPPIPGLPLCVSNPLSFEICAVYFVMNGTILSGSVGGLIVPAIVALVSIAMIIYFIMQIRRIIDRSEEAM